MFKAVTDYGGFNQAAAHIHKSQSSIHKAVGKIEYALGIKLFHIEGKKTQLTQQGVLVLQRAEYLLSEAAKLEQVGISLGKGLETQLRIAVDEIYPLSRVYDVLDGISRRYPSLNVSLIESILGGATELVEKGEVDLAIAPFEGANCVNESLCQIEFIAVAHPSHPLHRRATALTYMELTSHRQIVIRDSSTQENVNSGWLGSNQRWTVSHLRTSIDIISKGLGFAWLPKTSIENELAGGILKPLNLKRLSTRTADLYLVYKDADNLGPATKSFVADLRQEVL